MAKQILPTNFKDDILSPSMGGKRKYRLIDNGDGTYLLEDVTDYTQTGSDFGAGQINATNQAVNESCDKADVIDDLEDVVANQANGKIAGAKAVSELNGNLNDIHFEVIESEHYYVKKYENGYFESDFKTQLSPSLGNPLTFQALTSGQTIFYRARITNMGIGITVTEIYSLELTAQNTGIIWPASPSMNANMQAVDTYVIQQGSDNTRTTTIRGRVTGKWK